jgi:hypothetical protein
MKWAVRCPPRSEFRAEIQIGKQNSSALAVVDIGLDIVALAGQVVVFV